jgi:hypothetical protein
VALNSSLACIYIYIFFNTGRWEHYLPKKGPVHDACIQYLLDKGIELIASKNLSGNDKHVISTNTAVKKLIKHINNRFDQFRILNDDKELWQTLTIATGKIISAI